MKKNKINKIKINKNEKILKGSGSMSVAIARIIAPKGHLHTFEFHKQRSELAQKEFEHYGVSEYITVKWRDVYEEGYITEKLKEEQADAIFLDLPKPWMALEHAFKVLKPGCMLASYSPCIEQVQKTCLKLSSMNFQGNFFFFFFFK